MKKAIIASLVFAITGGAAVSATAGSLENLERERALAIAALLDSTIDVEARWSKLNLSTARLADLEVSRSTENKQFSGQQRDRLHLWSSLNIEKHRDNQRTDKLYDRKLDVQIFQKVRRALCSLSTKRSPPRRSGRSPPG